MAANKALLLDQQERLRRLGDQVPRQAEVFHRDRLALLVEVTSALSWRGLFSKWGNGDEDERTIRVDSLVRLGEGLLRLFERAGQVQSRLNEIEKTLGRIKDRRLAEPDCVPAAIERTRRALRSLGEGVKIDEDLSGELRGCDKIQADTHALAEAVEQWASAEDVLIRSQTSSGPLAVALPELRERLCRDGPTPDWQSDLQAQLGPLEKLARREQPPEIRRTDRIVRLLPRWVKVLGNEVSQTEQDEVRDLEIRFKRQDWAGEDDCVFQDLLERAVGLHEAMLQHAAELRLRRIDELSERYELFAALAGPDERLAEALKELRLDAPDNPHDHDDWSERLRETTDQLEARVRGAENDLLSKLREHLKECRTSLDAMDEIARLDEKDGQLRQAKHRYEELLPAAKGTDTRDLLDKVLQTQKLADDLRDLNQAMQDDCAGLQAQRDRLVERAKWLRQQSQTVAASLAPNALDLEQLADPGSRKTNLQQERQALEERERLLGEAEARLADACRREIEQTSQRIGQMTEVIGPDRLRAATLDLSALLGTPGHDLADLIRNVQQVRSRLTSVERLLVEEEQASTARIKELQDALVAVPPEQLGLAQRSERDLMLRQLERRDPRYNADAVTRIGELRELILSTESILSRFAAAAQALQERREQLRERLRRFNRLFLQPYCAELYRRVEGLLHPPEQTRWPEDAESQQLEEADRLLSRLERQSERLAAREIAEHLTALDQHAQRATNSDAQALALMREIAGRPPEQPLPAPLRLRLAELARSLPRWR